MIPNVLSIAGMDPSGGAGAIADVKAISACGCYGLAVITALTAQNTRRVCAIHTPPALFVGAQIDAIFSDIRVDAVKIGMIGTAEIAHVVADRLSILKPRFVVLDPVAAASSGDALATAEAVDVVRARLMPLATVVTPNLAEAARLIGVDEPLADDAQIASAGSRLLGLGAAAALIKGGHRPGSEAKRRLVHSERRARLFRALGFDVQHAWNRLHALLRHRLRLGARVES